MQDAIRTFLLLSLSVVGSTSLVACNTTHVQLKAGDCVNAATNAVGCADREAVQRVVVVIRTEGAFASCPPPLSGAAFTEGGDGPMIGITVCMEPVATPGST